MPARFLTVLCCLFAMPALAAGDPDAIKGLLAENCSECHAIPGFATPDTGLDAPAFTTIADEPSVYTEERLRASLQKPHWPMGGQILSPSDIDNILAYLATLRQR